MCQSRAGPARNVEKYSSAEASDHPLARTASPYESHLRRGLGLVPSKVSGLITYSFILIVVALSCSAQPVSPIVSNLVELFSSVVLLLSTF